MNNTMYTKIERYGNDILWTGYDNGKRFYKKVKYQPTFYVEDRQNEDQKPSHVSLIGDRPLKSIQCDDMKRATEFVERYKDVQNMVMCGNTNYVASFTYDMYPGTIDFDPSLINIFTFDIEVDISKKKPDMETADNEITSVAIKSSKSSNYYMFGTKDYDPEKTITGIDPSLIKYHKCQSEYDMLNRFVDLWCSDYPDVVTGWNVELFDITYIVKRIENILGMAAVKRLSPWGHVRERSFEMFNKMQKTYVISGISIVDYMNAFKKFGYKYGTMQSYKLDNVATIVLGTKKLSYEAHGNKVDTHRFISDGAKDVKISRDLPDDVLTHGEMCVKRRDVLLEEIQRRGLSV
jgi:DNA polymerase elongation subunit (family B)